MGKEERKNIVLIDKKMTGGQYCRQCPYAYKLYDETYVCRKNHKTVVNRRGGGTVSSMKCDK